MEITQNDINPLTHTSHKVVFPFYGYAALAFLTATGLLCWSATDFTGHYFNPRILALTHIMALGWATMIILGASYQLIPVLVENKLYCQLLAHLSFILAATGIPFLVYAFYTFDMGVPAKTGGILINASVVCYIINLGTSIAGSKRMNIHAVFIFTASLWLLLTTSIGLILVFNFSMPFLPFDSLHYLSLHAHIGIAGWFFLVVTGTASRLLPLFLLSKYSSPILLQMIYVLVNGALLFLVAAYLYVPISGLFMVGWLLGLTAAGFFIFYCYNCFRTRIRRHIDVPMRISGLSVLMVLIPALLLSIIIATVDAAKTSVKTAYGFSILFGWLTAIIIGMTFKTLPFITWAKHFQEKIGFIKTPAPKDLFSDRFFTITALLYVSGFILFMLGILFTSALLLKAAAFMLFLSALFYNLNVFKLLLYKPL